MQDIVFEKRERIPYLEVLNNLSSATGILAIGSTEMHYTASKIFQSILSKKPVFTVFHHQSTVINILKETNAGTYLVKYVEEEKEVDFELRLRQMFQSFLIEGNGWNPILEKMQKYSARSSAGSLTGVLNAVVK